MINTQDFYNKKKAHNILELEDLNKKNGVKELEKLTKMGQARMTNFQKVYDNLNQILLDNNANELNKIPLLLNESKNDIKEMIEIIQGMKNLNLYTQTEDNTRNKTVEMLARKCNEYSTKLKQIGDKLNQKQQNILERAKQSIHRESLHNDSQLQIQLLEGEHYDEQFVEARSRQITEIAKIVSQLGEMMNDAAKMIQAQGEQIDIIEGNITKSKINVKDAKEQIKIAANVQTNNNGRILFFCGISTLIIVVIVLLFSAGTRKNTGPIQN